jgi:hypothetical protein
MVGRAPELASHSERGSAKIPAWNFDSDGHLYDRVIDYWDSQWAPEQKYL